MTNGDKVRQMTDAELADALEWHYVCPPNTKCEHGADKTNCRACWMEWLKQEAKGESK
jgi:hypothetical protein